MLSRSIINLIKKILGIPNWDVFKKNWKKRIGKLIYKKKFNSADVLNKMIKMGMKPGDLVFIHSSMKEFYNFIGTGEELINTIIKYLGPEGTLAMPAYPMEVSNLTNKCLTKNYHGKDDPILFEVNSTPTGAGYLAEVFRKMPGVKRSINIQHSVCAIGKYADELISEHHFSETCWDEKSPFYKLTQLDAKIFSFGMPYFLPTIIHCTDSLLFGKYEYFNQFFQKDITYNYKDANDNIGTHRMLMVNIERRQNKKRMVKKYFAKDKYLKDTISNLRIELYSARYTHERFMELARKGIVMYTKPSPKGYHWDK